MLVEARNEEEPEAAQLPLSGALPRQVHSSALLGGKSACVPSPCPAPGTLQRSVASRACGRNGSVDRDNGPSQPDNPSAASRTGSHGASPKNRPHHRVLLENRRGLLLAVAFLRSGHERQPPSMILAPSASPGGTLQVTDHVHVMPSGQVHTPNRQNSLVLHALSHSPQCLLLRMTFVHWPEQHAGAL